MVRSKVVQGTFVLVIAGLTVRLLGFVYRVALTRVIGSEGMGLFQMVFPVFILAITAATMGVPVALSKEVASSHAQNDWRAIDSARKVSLLIAFGGAVAVSLLLLAGADWISTAVLSDARIRLSIMLLPGAVIFSALASTFRGYFQGLQEMVPTGASQVVEQVVRVTVMLVVVGKAMPYGLEWAVAAAIAAVGVGELAGLLTLWAYRVGERFVTRPWGRSQSTTALPRVAMDLLGLSVPVALTRFAGSFGHLLDASLIPTRLQVAGSSIAEATALFGQLSGMALPVLYLPTVLIFPLATAILPAVSESYSRHNYELLQTRVKQALGFTLAVGIITVIALRAGAGLIATLLYDLPEVGPLIEHVAYAAPFAYLFYISASILNGLGRTSEVFYISMASTALRIGLLFVLVTPGLGITGAILAYTSGLGLAAALNLARVFLHIRKGS